MLGTDLEVIWAMVTCKGINWNGWDYLFKHSYGRERSRAGIESSPFRTMHLPPTMALLLLLWSLFHVFSTQQQE